MAFPFIILKYYLRHMKKIACGQVISLKMPKEEKDVIYR